MHTFTPKGQVNSVPLSLKQVHHPPIISALSYLETDTLWPHNNKTPINYFRTDFLLRPLFESRDFVEVSIATHILMLWDNPGIMEVSNYKDEG